jgi:hypothetical protein
LVKVIDQNLIVLGLRTGIILSVDDKTAHVIFNSKNRRPERILPISSIVEIDEVEYKLTENSDNEISGLPTEANKIIERIKARSANYVNVDSVSKTFENYKISARIKND